MQVSQVAVFEQSVDNVCKADIFESVTMKDERIDKWLIGCLSGEELLHGSGVPFIQVIVVQTKSAVANFTEDREGHHLLVIAFIHEDYIGVFCDVWNNRVFG